MQIFFLVSQLAMVCMAWDELIGNYSQYFPDYNMCGISDKFQTDSNCFEYHRDISSQLKYGRDVRQGEAPWVVAVEVRTDDDKRPIGICTGSFISKRWVLTSAHCLKAKKYRIFQSTKYMGVVHIFSEYTIAHPTYNTKDSQESEYYDIGLIKIVSEAGPEQRDPGSTFLCLPTKNFPFYYRRMAMVAGWSKGSVDNDLQIGSIILQKESNPNLPDMLVAINVSDGTESCPGDSGAPFWVYHMGRAVIVGINKGNLRYRGDKSPCGMKMFGPYVPFHLDWILETIRKYDKLP